MIRRPPRSTLFPTRRSSDLSARAAREPGRPAAGHRRGLPLSVEARPALGIDQAGERAPQVHPRSEEHTSELQSLAYLVCRLLLEKKKKKKTKYQTTTKKLR